MLLVLVFWSQACYVICCLCLNSCGSGCIGVFVLGDGGNNFVVVVVAVVVVVLVSTEPVCCPDCCQAASAVAPRVPTAASSTFEEHYWTSERHQCLGYFSSDPHAGT